MDVLLNILTQIALHLGIYAAATLASPAMPNPQNPDGELKPPVVIEQVEIERAIDQNTGS